MPPCLGSQTRCKDLPNKLFLTLICNSVVDTCPGWTHLANRMGEGAGIQEKSLFSFSVWTRCVTFAHFIFIRKLTWGGGWGEEVVRIPRAAYQSAILCTSRMLWQRPGPQKQKQNSIFAGALFFAAHDSLWQNAVTFAICWTTNTRLAPLDERTCSRVILFK